MDVMKSDRWCAPWVSLRGDRPKFEVYFCVDGHGYVLRPRTKESYRFETHEALATFLDNTKKAHLPGWRSGHTNWGSYPAGEPNIWNASGSFDTKRATIGFTGHKNACSRNCFRYQWITHISRQLTCGPADAGKCRSRVLLFDRRTTRSFDGSDINIRNWRWHNANYVYPMQHARHAERRTGADA